MEGHGEARLAERLHGLRLAQDPRARRNEHLSARVRVERVRDQAVHRRGLAPSSRLVRTVSMMVPSSTR